MTEGDKARELIEARRLLSADFLKHRLRVHNDNADILIGGRMAIDAVREVLQSPAVIMAVMQEAAAVLTTRMAARVGNLRHALADAEDCQRVLDRERLAADIKTPAEPGAPALAAAPEPVDVEPTPAAAPEPDTGLSRREFLKKYPTPAPNPPRPKLLHGDRVVNEPGAPAVGAAHYGGHRAKGR